MVEIIESSFTVNDPRRIRAGLHRATIEIKMDVAGSVDDLKRYQETFARNLKIMGSADTVFTYSGPGYDGTCIANNPGSSCAKPPGGLSWVILEYSLASNFPGRRSLVELYMGEKRLDYKDVKTSKRAIRKAKKMLLNQYLLRESESGPILIRRKKVKND